MAGKRPERRSWPNSEVECLINRHRAEYTMSGSLKLRAASGGTLAVSRREIRAQHVLALETAGFEASMRFGNFIERYPRGNAWMDSATCQ